MGHVVNKSVFKDIIDSLIEGVYAVAFGPASEEQFISSLLSTSGYTPAPDYATAKKCFEMASTQAYMLMSSHIHKIQINGQTALGHLRHLAEVVPLVTKWCASVVNNENATDEEKDLALSTYDSFRVGVGRLNEVIKGIREGTIKVSWDRDPGDLPDIPIPVVVTRK